MWHGGVRMSRTSGGNIRKERKKERGERGSGGLRMVWRKVRVCERSVESERLQPVVTNISD